MNYTCTCTFCGTVFESVEKIFECLLCFEARLEKMENVK